jgi:glutamate racemase
MTIGFFDSGIGGFYLMERTMRAMPQYDYVFYGDTKHLPYGDKRESEIYRLTRNAVWYLFSAHDAELVILACNTASAETLRKLQDEFLTARYPKRRILGVIIPTIEELIDSGATKALLIGTARTVSSRKYEKELAKRGVTFAFKTHATPELVPMIEAGDLEGAYAFLAPILKSHQEGGGDAVVLGCTHYALLTGGLRTRHPELRFLSQDEIIPKKLEDYLARHTEIERLLSRRGEREVIWSGAEAA